jgi:diguanylate cyclase (GGDEF)-like protein
MTAREGSIAEVLSLLPELLACHGLDALLKRAVELARDRIGVERCAIFLPDATGRQMRGTWGTSLTSQTTDERNLIFELEQHDRQAIELLSQGETRWVLVDGVARGHNEGDRPTLLAYGWVVLTPIEAINGSVAYFYNDAVITGRPVDYHQQELVAVFCALVGQISARRRAESSLRHRSLIDPVTRLPSHALFLDRLGRRAARTDQHGAGYAVLAVGLDRWTTITQRHAPRFLELLATAVAGRIASSLGPHDSAARVGGDEFAVLCDRAGTDEDLMTFGRRMLDHLSRPLMVENENVHLTASIGLARASQAPMSAEEHLQNARAALAKARSLGSGHMQLFSPKHREVVSITHQLENQLMGALERRELLLHYQPIYGLSGLSLTGFEALLRWQHPRRGLIPPSTFIPLAEETELIVPIGAWVMREACAALRRWQAELPQAESLTVSVNLSPRQFLDDALLGTVEASLQETGLMPECLVLEITESSVMQDLERAIHTLRALRSLGVRIALDDFGTGYSSLSYLCRLPLDIVKVDRSFVLGLGEDQRSNAIVRSVLELGQSLGLEVVVEGVENEQQLALLRALACQNAQGFLLGRPLEETAARALVGESVRPSRRPRV